jgi:2-polyprenyl-3-methyl-5-hydroxy-6-metoxy-1,4-benzoquinol methylase
MEIAYEATACPVCGESQSLEVADNDAINDEVADLWTFHTRRMRPTTDPRDLTDRVAFSQAPPIRVAQCTSCTHFFRNPRERQITDLYGSEVVDAETMEELFLVQRESFARQVERLSALAPVRANGLEIGSYVGAFLDAARGAGWQFEGYDVNPVAVEFARRKRLDVHVGTIDDVEPGSLYDVVSIWNCFEQLADVRAVIRTAHSLLHATGILTIRVPNAAYWAAMRRHRRGIARPVSIAALAQNNLLSFPYRNGFTPASLRALCERNGFTVLKTYGEFSLPTGTAGAPRWAAVEGRVVHRLVRALGPITGAPWIEFYARRA